MPSPSVHPTVSRGARTTICSSAGMDVGMTGMLVLCLFLYTLFGGRSRRANELDGLVISGGNPATSCSAGF